MTTGGAVELTGTEMQFIFFSKICNVNNSHSHGIIILDYWWSSYAFAFAEMATNIIG